MSVVACFSKVLYNGFLTRATPFSVGSSSRKLSLWVPDYLEKSKSKYPEYELINIQIRGYDYALLENFQSKIHWFAKQLGLDITNCWSHELQKLRVTRLKQRSNVPVAEYIMKKYERNVQLAGVYSHQMPILLEIIAAACPPGVSVSAHPHTEEIEEGRYVPEYDVLELKNKLDIMKKEK